MDIITNLSKLGIVPILTVSDPATAVQAVNALKRGGLPAAEITFRTDEAEEAIRRVKGETEGVLLGAGTILSIEQAQRAVKAGAEYILTPGFNEKVVSWCADNGVPVLPGCSSPSDIEKALEKGVTTVKLFPVEAIGGVKFIKAVSAPYTDMGFVPTGGVNTNNMNDYFALKSVKAVGGSWLATKDDLAGGDWAGIEEKARRAVAAMLNLRVNHVGINAESMEDSDRITSLVKLMMGDEVKDIGWMNIVGPGFEVLYGRKRGVHGHFAINTNSLERAMYHLEQRGFEFNEPLGPTAVFMKDTIGGFEVELVQR